MPALIVALLMLAVGLQAAHSQLPPLQTPENASLFYFRAPHAARRAVLGFDGIAADIYWIRALQYYGATKLSTDPAKRYDDLYPLLDLTTTLDPHFDIAYKFGAIFLSERFPNGPGRADQAIALLEKGLAAQPHEWEFAQQIGFVHYWWRNDYRAAADWFLRAGAMPGAPSWLTPLAAVTLAQGGSRASSRQLWQQVSASATEDWLKQQADQRLRQLDALDRIDALVEAARRYLARTGALPQTWDDLVRAGELQVPPVDPAGYPFVLDPQRAVIRLSPQSTLNPLPVEPVRVEQAPAR